METAHTKVLVTLANKFQNIKHTHNILASYFLSVINYIQKCLLIINKI